MFRTKEIRVEMLLGGRLVLFRYKEGVDGYYVAWVIHNRALAASAIG